MHLHTPDPWLIFPTTLHWIALRLAGGRLRGTVALRNGPQGAEDELKRLLRQKDSGLTSSETDFEDWVC